MLHAMFAPSLQISLCKVGPIGALVATEIMNTKTSLTTLSALRMVMSLRLRLTLSNQMMRMRLTLNNQIMRIRAIALSKLSMLTAALGNLMMAPAAIAVLGFTCKMMQSATAAVGTTCKMMQSATALSRCMMWMISSAAAAPPFLSSRAAAAAAAAAQFTMLQASAVARKTMKQAIAQSMKELDSYWRTFNWSRQLLKA